MYRSSSVSVLVFGLCVYSYSCYCVLSRFLAEITLS